MQGFNWTSNQQPPPKYQEQPPPKYQEQPPPKNQEQPPPKYQEQPPPKYQERHPPMYQPTRNDQIKLKPQLYNSVQLNVSNAQQQYWNYPQVVRSSSEKSLALSFQPNANLTHPNLLGSQTQQHCTQGMVSQPEVPSKNPKTNRLYAQFNTQYVPFSQNYRNPGPVQNNHDPNQAPVYWSCHSDHGGSRTECNDNTRSWKLHISDNGSSHHMNNQQQHPSSRTAPLHHQQRFSGKQAGKPLTMHHSTPVLSQQSTSLAQNNVTTQRMYTRQAQNTATVHHTSRSSPTLPPSGAQKSISPPSYNFQQSPVNQRQLVMRMNAGPNLSATQFQNSRQSIENRTCGINQTTINQTQQRTPTNKAHLNPQSKPDFNLKNPYVYPLLCKLMYSHDNEQGFANSSVTNNQPSDDRTGNQKASNRTDYYLYSQRHLSLQSSQFTDEPPSKRINNGLSQKDYWNQVPSKELCSISKDASGLASQSALPGIYQTGRTEQNSSEKRHDTRQHKVQYTTDPADCLEAVFALMKAAQHVHKAVAIVPPISQQTSNTAQMDDTSPKTVDSPPLKIDAIWSIAEEPDAQSPVTKINDKLYQSPAPIDQQDDRSLSIQNETTNTDTCIPQSSDICSANSKGGCQNYLQQNDIQHCDCDSGDTVFNLSNVPVDEYTLLNLMNLAKSIQMEEITKLSTRLTEIPESVFNWILELYWKGNTYNLVKSLKSHRKLIERSLAGGVKNYESVVFESISSDNWKKLDHCDILENGIYLSSEEFRSSWLNVDGWPADIDKVLSEPLSDYVPSDNVGVNSLKEAPEVTSLSTVQSVKPNTSHTEVFTPLAGYGKQETAIKYKVRADLSPLSEMPSEDLIDNSKDSSKETKVLKKQHIRVTQDINLSSSREVICLESAVSDSLAVNPVDEHLECVSAVSDDGKTSKMSFSTEALSNATNTCQVEDISDDENSGNKQAASNSINTCQVEDISDDENSGNKEAASNSINTCQVEDISDDDNLGNVEAPQDIWLVEDNSDNENSDEPDIYVVEAVSNDENSSDDSPMMEVTVLSSEDAINFFQQLQKEPQCNVKTTSTQSNVDTPKLVAWFSSPSQPNHECSEAKICSCCGTNRIEKSSSPHMTKKYNDGEIFCSHCWDEAPSLKLEGELFSPMRNKTSGTPTKSDECSSPPNLELKVQVSSVPLTEEYIEDKGLIGKKSDNMVKSAMPDVKMLEIQSSVEEVLPKIQPDKVKSDIIGLTKLQMPIQCNTPPPTKSVFGEHKPKSDSTGIGVEERNDLLQTVIDRISQSHTESLHKVREKVSSHSNTTQCMTAMPHKSNDMLDMNNGAQLFKKMRKNEKKKVTFALYGSKDEDHCVALELHSPAPPTLTVSTAGKDYAGVLSAKQKVHNQWSSTYIPKVKKNSKPNLPQVKKRMTSLSKSPQKMKMISSPPKTPWQKKKMQKPQEALKLKMDALKSHLKQRAVHLSSKKIEQNYSRKTFSQQKLTNTLHDTTLQNSLEKT